MSLGNRWTSVLCLQAIYFLATACGPLYPSVPATLGPSGSGTWSGNLNGSEGGYAVAEFVSGDVSVDSSGILNGSLAASDGSTVTLSGVVSGTTINSLNVTVESVVTTMSGQTNCSGALGGTGSLTSLSLAANVSGMADCGPASMTLNLQTSGS